MFVALHIIPRPTDGIIARLSGILRKPKTWLESRQCLDASYGVIHAELKNGAPDWEEVEYLAEDYGRNIVLPEVMIPPEDSMLRIYCPAAFNRKVLLRTACVLIHRTRMPMYRRVLGLIDEDGSCADMLPQLLKYYTAVKVVTKNLTRYRFAGEEMMHELGAPVIVGDRLSQLQDCVLALSPHAFHSEEAFRLPCPVLAGDTCSLCYRTDLFTAPEVRLPPFSPQPPQGIPAHLLAGALHELCGLEGLELSAHTLLYNNKFSSLAEAVRAVALSSGILYAPEPPDDS